MAIVKMKKMYVFGLHKERDRILSALQKLGAVEIADLKEENIDVGINNEKLPEQVGHELSELELKLGRLKFAIDFLKPYGRELNPLIHGRPRVSMRKLQDLLNREGEIFELVDSLSGVDQKLSRLKTEESRIKNQIELIKPWERLDVPVEELGSTGKVEVRAVAVPKKNFKPFMDKAVEKDLPVEIMPVGEGREDSLLLMIYHNSAKSDIQELFKEFSVNTEEFSGFSGTPAQIIDQFQERLKVIEAERQEVKAEISGLADRLLDLEALYDYWFLEKQKKENFLKMVGTDKVFLMKAWVPEPSVGAVKEAVTSTTGAVHVVFAEPSEEDDIPVALSNPRLVQPFEIITELYSLPDPRGIDPNVFMAPFYFVFFGMMVSDAGYGLVLSLLTGLALWKLKLKGMGKKLAELLFLGGISTFVWGMIFGSWFGDLIKVKPLWLNPLDNPLAVLFLSFAFGLIQIYTGIILNGYRNIRNGKIADALMDQGLWLVLLTGLVMMAFPNFAGIAKSVALAGAVGLVLTQGRSQKGIIKKFTSGLLSLYNVTGYLSDVLSYSRLLALGLATGVIAMVINTMARMLGVNILGYIAMLLVMIGGHFFNIAVNALGAYVHSSRLQYIEFFGKFYDGGGRSFDPLRIRTKYVDLEDA
ncbi:V-type ATP synthase subunit I [Thermosediminibacter litoriperuensis]|uniref:V/A-type H+-transporting ATPase subunit I n=1 Tax=Thermosediminibacter litoriperuensis TaxID=291989 RepID=A0A5S5B0M8_9FIRM|nr:V-type ATP synthase subunit I [Thermosediminibacter litoriperuensis]TYP58776.1 V/A-type H+-transporting ATPase subunit I [Thermosediminibacter litoriperuensis]